MRKRQGKALKAFLISFSGSYPRIHSIAELLARASSYVGEMEEMMERGRILDEYYTPTRYPNGVPGTLPQGQPSEQHASEALAAAHRIVKMCREGIENREDL